MDYNSDFRFDLELGQQGETTFGAIFSGAKIEVKTDFAAYRTGNFFIEYESRDKPSGLATTHACLPSTRLRQVRGQTRDNHNGCHSPRCHRMTTGPDPRVDTFRTSGCGSSPAQHVFEGCS